MFFFQKTTVPVTFEIDEYRLRDFTEALSVLGLTKEEAFDQFLSLLMHEALHPEKQSLDPSEASKKGSDRLSQKAIESRIKAWAIKKKCHPHLMMKAYFLCRDVHGEEHLYREKMGVIFDELAGLEYGNNTFMTVFRQMCSNAGRAYGDVFECDRRTKIVTLNPFYASLINSPQDQFLDKDIEPKKSERLGFFHDEGQE